MISLIFIVELTYKGEMFYLMIALWISHTVFIFLQLETDLTISPCCLNIMCCQFFKVNFCIIFFIKFHVSYQTLELQFFLPKNFSNFSVCMLVR